MAAKIRSRSPPTIWTYAYEIFPPQPHHRLGLIVAVLDDEHLNARAAERKWVGRLISEKRITHILVVSDSPELDREVNHRLEAGLRKLQAGFSLTVPIPVTDEEPPLPAEPPAALPSP